MSDTRHHDPSGLSNEEIARYSRHLIMPEVTVEGQKRLKGNSVLLVGAGGLGSPLALYLAAAGIGRIGIVDFDVVDHSNLHRQILHGTSDVGRSKLESAQKRITDLNPHVVVESHEARLTSENALDIIRQYDVIADGTDNFPTRYLVNDSCVLLGKPNVYGSIFRFEGQASVFHHDGGPCYRCLYPEPPPPGVVPSCAEGGVLGILPGMIGVIQATEVVKIMLGKGRTLSGRLLLYDAMNMSFREMKLRRNSDCPVCGDTPTVSGLIDYEEFCGVPGTRSDGEVDRDINRMVREQLGEEAGIRLEESMKLPGDMSVRELAERLESSPDSVLLIDVREPHELMICAIGDAINIPMGTIPEKIAEIDRTKDVALLCRSGIRSARVAMYLAHLGYSAVFNVTGGILAWADEIDRSMAQY